MKKYKKIYANRWIGYKIDYITRDIIRNEDSGRKGTKILTNMSIMERQFFQRAN